MKKMNLSVIRFALIFAILTMLVGKGISQTSIPDVLLKNTLVEQMNYIQERTKIYEDYRAIREDIFQKIKGNALDSLSAAKKQITRLNKIKTALNFTIDSINTSFGTTKDKLDEITRTKNSIRVLGLEVNKITYNTLMWTIVAGLIGIVAVGFLAFKRNLVVTIHAKKDYEELKNEFEAYRKTSREAREKMSMAHFNELQKLKGG
jgi:hypothetical protein